MRCRNLATVSWNSNVCRYHGAKKKDAVKSGQAHWNYQHGQETRAAKADRSYRLKELRDLEELSFALGLARGPKWRGRKPVTCRK